MVQVRKFEILLDGSRTVYSSGDVVSGEVEVDVDERLEVTAIQVKILGKAHCGWSEGRNCYFANEKTLNETKVLLGEGAGEKGPLSKGSRRLPFRFQLPHSLVGSYADAIGYVRYSVKAKMIRSFRSDSKTKKEIKVYGVKDLTQLDNMMAPTSGSAETPICCGCASGPIDGEVHAERTGYGPGDIVVARGKLTNNSSSKAKLTSLEIVRHVTYRTPWRTRWTPYTLVWENGPPCPPGRSVDFNNVKLQMPQGIPTNTTLKIMKFEYSVVIRGHLRRCTLDARAFAPIVVGTVPLGNGPNTERVGESSMQRQGFGYQGDSSGVPLPGEKEGISNTAFYSWDQPASS